MNARLNNPSKNFRHQMYCCKILTCLKLITINISIPAKQKQFSVWTHSWFIIQIVTPKFNTYNSDLPVFHILYMLTLHVSTTCQYYMSTLHVNTACEHYMSTLHAITTCQHYMSTLHVNTTCQHYVSALHVNTTCQYYCLTLSLIIPHWFITE